MQIIGNNLRMSNLTYCVDCGIILIQNRAVRDTVELGHFSCGTLSKSMCPEATWQWL